MTTARTALNHATNFLTDNNPRCGERTPVWRSTGTMLGAVLGVTIWATATRRLLWPFGDLLRPGDSFARFLVNLLTALMAGMIVSFLLDLAFGTTHYHCDECGRCAIKLGVPAYRSHRRTLQATRRAGWEVVGRRESYCRAHAHTITQG